jgi:hypothetical protein
MLRKAENARAEQGMHLISARDSLAYLPNEFGKLGQLLLGKGSVLVRNREMRRNTVQLHIGESRNSFQVIEGFSFPATHSAHSRVDREIERTTCKGSRFLETGDRGDEPMFTDGWPLPGQRRTQNQDWMGNAAGAQLQRFMQIRDPEKVCLIAERIGHFDHAMAVPVRFDYGEKIRFRSDTLERQTRIAAQSFSINFRPTAIRS